VEEMRMPSADDLRSQYGTWGDYGKAFPVSDWEMEVANGETRLGYWEWVAAGIEYRNSRE
jgi:hypothetical protein